LTQLSARVRPWAAEGALVTSVAALAAVLLMGQVSLAPSKRIYGLPTDPLGEAWRLAQFDRGEIALIGDEVSDEANAPSGVHLRRPADAAQILYDLPASLTARALGPVLSYNLFVFLALWTAALATYASMRSLGLRPAGSAVAAALFALAPIHMLEAKLHVALAFVFMLPILLALGVHAIQRPSWRRGAFFGAALGLCGYVTGYLFLEAAVLAVGVLIAAAVRFALDAPMRPQLAQAVVAGLLSAVAVLSPLLVVLAVYHGSLAPELNRPVSDVATFSLRARDFLDPDSTTYLGLAGVVLACAGLAYGCFGSTARRTVALVGVVGFLVSLRPEFTVVGAQLPMPSKVIHSLVPYWRVFGRTAIVAALAVACLAGALVDRLASSRRPGIRLAAVGLVVIALADIAERPPKPAADLGRPDPLAAALRGGVGAVAEYPLYGFDNYNLGPYLLRQLRHGRPLLNGSIEGTTSADLARAAATPVASEARDALSLAGVRTVVVHAGVPGPRGPGFRLKERLGDGTSLYAVVRSPHAAVASARGAYAAESGPDETPFQWLGPSAQIRVITADGRNALLALTAVSQGAPRTVRFGRKDIAVLTGPTQVRLCLRLGVRGTVSVPISMDPPPRHLPGGDPRVSGIGIYHLHAEPTCSRRAARNRLHR
jgi:hypothetical protein